MSNRDMRPIQVGLRLLALIVVLGIQPSSLSDRDRPGSNQERTVGR
jgi:hypothetical protein